MTLEDASLNQFKATLKVDSWQNHTVLFYEIVSFPVLALKHIHMYLYAVLKIILQIFIIHWSLSPIILSQFFFL